MGGEIDYSLEASRNVYKITGLNRIKIYSFFVYLINRRYCRSSSQKEKKKKKGKITPAIEPDEDQNI